MQVPPPRLCFGLSGIQEPEALEICTALARQQKVRARELSEEWLRRQPDSPAAQYALAEVLLEAEGNMPRAVYHLSRAEQLTDYRTLDEARRAGAFNWHFLTLLRLADVYLLMNEPLKALAYSDKLSRIYDIDMESARGWPLIKLKQYDAARASAERVLAASTDPNQRARAWNTICAADLASLRPPESMAACDIAVDEPSLQETGPVSIIDLSNAAEVALSLLQIDRAESYLQRAVGMNNPRSTANPWVQLLYLLMNQGRFDESRSAFDSMLITRQAQEPLTTMMNRAEHYMVGAGFLLLAGYAEDAARLSVTALNQPDRTGSYTADDRQKDAYAALMALAAGRSLYQSALEEAALLSFWAGLPLRLSAWRLRLDAWRAGRRAAALFADLDTLQSRLRPYAPLDVHIPEWLEPEIIRLVGSGVMEEALEKARSNGAFQLNAGYYHAYRAEIAALRGEAAATVHNGAVALSQLPPAEVLLRARLHGRLGQMGGAGVLAGGDAPNADVLRGIDDAGDFTAAEHYAHALSMDPGVLRRLGLSLPVSIRGDGSDFAAAVEHYLLRSPRFHRVSYSYSDDDGDGGSAGLRLEIKSGTEPSVCLFAPGGDSLACHSIPMDAAQDSRWNARALSRGFHRTAFGLNYEISKAQISVLWL